MRAWSYGQLGLENLGIGERSVASPREGEILLRMKAASLNFRDLLMIEGRYNPRLRFPLVPCSDGVGIVEAVGPGVDEWRPGDRALPIFAGGWYDGAPRRMLIKRTLGGPLDGTLCEQMIVRAGDAVLAPSYLDDAAAATLPCAALTAWSALVEYGSLRAGETVLILGTGGVSIFALQFAKLAGAEVIITSSSESKLEKARSLGADHTINYREHPDWEREVFRLTGRSGVDHVVEVGGMGTLHRSIRSVRPGGSIYLIGVLSGREAPLDLTPVLMQGIRIQGVMVGHRRSFLEMNRALQLHQVQPVLDQTFPFEAAPAAFEHLRSGSHFGKVAVVI